jgi:hypothetical protein
MHRNRHCPRLHCLLPGFVVKKKRGGDLYSAYPALPGRSRRWAEYFTRVTRQTGKLNERSRTATSRSQQQIRTESEFTDTAGIRICYRCEAYWAHLSDHSAKSHPKER